MRRTPSTLGSTRILRRSSGAPRWHSPASPKRGLPEFGAPPPPPPPRPPRHNHQRARSDRTTIVFTPDILAPRKSTAQRGRRTGEEGQDGPLQHGPTDIDQGMMGIHCDRFRAISSAFHNSMSPYTRRVMCPTWCPCLSDIHWCVRSYVLPGQGEMMHHLLPSRAP